MAFPISNHAPADTDERLTSAPDNGSTRAIIGFAAAQAAHEFRMLDLVNRWAALQSRAPSSADRGPDLTGFATTLLASLRGHLEVMASASAPGRISLPLLPMVGVFAAALHQRCEPSPAMSEFLMEALDKDIARRMRGPEWIGRLLDKMPSDPKTALVVARPALPTATP